ncbi:MAG: hypothetical protein C0594_00155, partial [Marinilabiliales bacterium]
NNPAYLLRETGVDDLQEALKTGKVLEQDGKLIAEIKPDKMPIGIHERMDRFSTFEVNLLKGDQLYLFSDGYADQFGGPKGKKFKYKPFKRIIIENSHLSMEEQRLALRHTFNEWIACINPETGLPYEQIDDVCVAGVRIG